MSMGLLNLEHSKAAYVADFAFYGTAVPALALILAVEAPAARRVELAALVMIGLLAWTAIEYAIHRFVLHGLQPFKSWHAEHHRRPTALICAPTMFSATLITLLVFLPAWVFSNVWGALALTLGVLGGYLAYGVTHHATHHWRGDSGWLKRRKRAHALHHHADTPACYGVTSAFWDHVFRSARRRAVTA